jgi:hypothetical protein
VAKFKYLGMPLTNGSDIHKAINDRLNFRNPCYHSFQNLLPSIYKTHPKAHMGAKYGLRMSEGSEENFWM